MTCFLLADMGIIILDIYVFANKHVKVNTPTSLKGSSQLDEETLVRDRRNASKRIHVERIIGCAKTFKLMKTTTFKISLYCFRQSKLCHCHDIQTFTKYKLISTWSYIHFKMHGTMLLYFQIRVVSRHFTICMQMHYYSEFSAMYFTRLLP